MILFVFFFILCSSITCSSDCEVKNAVQYLHEFGFLIKDDIDTANIINSDIFNNSIKLFQEYYNIKINGELTNDTLFLMNKSRCGVKDVIDYYKVKPTVWNKKNLTWHFALAQPNILQLTEKAFYQWSNNSALTFTQNVTDPDILISFKRSLHKYQKTNTFCGFNFDGRGLILAHSYFPTNDQNTVEIHVDSDENWSYLVDNSEPEKSNLYNVLLHEIGHALGFEHSSDNKSIMYALYDSKLKTLGSDDIIAVQTYYGKPNILPPTILSPTLKTISENENNNVNILNTSDSLVNKNKYDLCQIKNALLLIINNRLFILYERLLWILDLTQEFNSEIPKPVLITDWLKFLPKNFKKITAAYQRPNGEVVIIVNNMIYMFDIDTLILQQGYPISLTVFNIPSTSIVQAIFSTYAGKSFLIFNDNNIVEIDECYFQTKRYTYLSNIFPNLPNSVDSVFRYINGNLYF